MARYTLFLKILIFVALVGYPGKLLFAEESKPKIAVFDFKVVGDTAELGELTAEILRTTLSETGKYTLIERDTLNQTIAQQKIGSSAISDQDSAANVGKIVGAKLIAVGSIMKMGETYNLNVRFIDLATGEPVSEKKITTQSKEAIPGLCNQMVELLVKDTAQGQDEELQPQPIIKPRKTQAPDNQEDLGTLLNLDINYPGAGLRYFLSNSTALELRGQFEKGTTVEGARLYIFPGSFKREGTIPYLGLEGDYGSFTGTYSKGNGYAGGGFAGLEFFMGKSVSWQADVGAAYVSLKDTATTLTQSGTEFTLNVGINIYF